MRRERRISIVFSPCKAHSQHSKRLWGRLLIKNHCRRFGMQMKRTRLRDAAAKLLIALALAGQVVATGCGHAKSDAEQQPVPEVTVTKVRRGVVAENVLVSGNLVSLPNKDAKITALVPGRIDSVLVTEGDSVKQGQILAHLEAVILHDQARQAEAAVAQARANVQNSKLATDREEGLLGRGISSRKEVEDAKTQ